MSNDAMREDFDTWFATSGIWNDAITWRAWQAALTSPSQIMLEHKLREIIAALILEADESGITQMTRKAAMDAISTPYRLPSSAPAQSEAKPVYPVYQIHSVDDGWQDVDIAEYGEWVYKKRIVYLAPPSAAPATAGGDALNTEGTCPDYARKQAQHAELESKYIAKCNECAELQSYLVMMTSGEPEPTAPDGDVGDVWHSIPWLPPEIDDDFYGTQYSVPVLLHDGEKVIERVARWSFVGDGWVGSDYAEGPDPSDYEWLNENAKKWMLLSDAALLAKRGGAS